MFSGAAAIAVGILEAFIATLSNPILILSTNEKFTLL